MSCFKSNRREVEWVEEDPENYFSLRIIVCPISECYCLLQTND